MSGKHYTHRPAMDKPSCILKLGITFRSGIWDIGMFVPVRPSVTNTLYIMKAIVGVFLNVTKGGIFGWKENSVPLLVR